MQLRVLAFVLAGGKGTRLYPLTKERAKPAVPFGGKYRIVDFVLSNLINSGIYSIYVLVQFKSQSLLQHLRDGWQFAGLLRNQFVIPVPAQMRYAGRDLVSGHRRRHLPEHQPDRAGGPAHRRHLRRRSHLPHEHPGDDRVPRTEAGGRHRGGDPGSQTPRHRVRRHRDNGRRLASPAFIEKRADAPDDSRRSRARFRFNGELHLLHPRPASGTIATRRTNNSSHDFGRDILPRLVGRIPMFAYDFQTNFIPGEPPASRPYWRDVGTIDAYYEANMDIRSVDPALNLYNRQWPLITAGYSDPPAKFVFDEEGRRGQAINSVVAGGTILSGGTVRNCVIGRDVRVHSGAIVEDSIVFDDCDIGRRAKNPARDSRQEHPRSRGYGDRLRPRKRPQASIT